jgi:hypothetical protein
MHQAARGFLMRRYRELSDSYAELPNDGRAADGYHYSLEARRIFPRYNVAAAMLEQVERLDPDRLPDCPNLRAALLNAAESAQSLFAKPPQGDVEIVAITDERELFASTVRSWISDSDLDTEPVAYRRVLTAEESSDWRQRLHLRWGLEDLSWHPMLAVPVPPDVLVLREDCMWEEQRVAQVRDALHDVGTQRVTELREYGADYRLDLQMFAPRYNGAEGVWCDDTLTWIAYASHEGTVAFGGLAATVLPATWSDLDRCRWSGWQHHAS